MSNNDGVGPGGKGDKQRPTDKKKFDEGYDRIVWKTFKQVKEDMKAKKENK